jgi:hypothetical protein
MKLLFRILEVEGKMGTLHLLWGTLNKGLD